jgi:endonuclease YncB( thermonuclease family)
MLTRSIINCCSALRSCFEKSINCYSYENTKKDDSFSELIPEAKYEWKNTVPFIPPIKTGHVIKVYDGDTITIATSLVYDESTVYRFPVRLNGIDAPEMHGKNEDEINAAKNAQTALEKLILHQDVILKNIQTEKYGRILADVYLGDVHINNWLIENHYVVKYDGGTKRSPKSWLKFQATGEFI